MDTDGDGLAVYLLPRDALNVDDVLQAVNGDDLAFTALERAAGDDDLVVFADGDGADLFVGEGVVRMGWSMGCWGGVRCIGHGAL